MRPRPLADAVGIISTFAAGTFIAPLVTGLLYGEETGATVLGYGLPALILVLLGFALRWAGRGESEALREKEAYGAVALVWLLLALVGALPYILTGTIVNPLDALFESMSGFTSTGATVLVDIDSRPHSILLWRSLTQWLGGMGIVVLSVAVLTRFLGGGRAGLLLMKGEVPGMGVTRMKPRIQETAMVLWKLYLGFTVAEALLLVAMGMNLFDGINHALTTLPGGGFNTHDGNIEYFHWKMPLWRQIGIEIILIIFMMAAATNFVLHYQVLKGRLRAPFREPEFRIFIYIVLLMTALVALDLTVHRVYPLGSAVRHGLFQVVSIVTTTGYNSVDFNAWPDTSRAILLLLMFTGAMSGSTSGAIKLARFFLVIKAARGLLTRFQRTKAVTGLRAGESTIPHGVIVSAGIYIFLYILVWVLASIVVSFTGPDMLTSFSAVATCIGNVGPGLGTVGPTANFLALHPVAKIVLISVMWMGRLEILACLILFFPSTYRA